MSRTPETLEIGRSADGVLAVCLNRPDVHNAFNETVIAELHGAFDAANQDPGVRVVVLTGNGKSFSAGADIEWMRAQGEASHAANLASAERMARMFAAIAGCRKPVVAGIHGAALGGGTGLAAAADIAIAEESATFGFTEVRLGIVPAVISPYVVAKISPAKARALFMTGERFGGREAERIGLVFRACPDGELAGRVNETVQHVLAGGPHAVLRAKQLVRDLEDHPRVEHAGMTAEWIARLRGTAEAREGLSAFLEKRKASWRDA